MSLVDAIPLESTQDAAGRLRQHPGYVFNLGRRKPREASEPVRWPAVDAVEDE